MHSAPEPGVTFKCKLCKQEFPVFYPIWQQKNTQHGFPIGTANTEPNDIINKEDDMNVKEEFCSCPHFFVDSQLEGSRHKLFNYAIENLNATIWHEEVDDLLNN